MQRKTSMTRITLELSNQEGEGSGSLGSPGSGRYETLFLMSPRDTTPHFLRICGLCKRRLDPGRDIYMYKGDTAFCSEVCRELRMEHDEAITRNGVVSPSSN